MSQAIYYIERNSEAYESIPEQAIAIVINDELNKDTLLTSIAKACNFPDYFGHNWDALWDCLTDTRIKYLQLNLSDIEKINTEDFNMFKSIIEDAYNDFGQPQLWVIN